MICNPVYTCVSGKGEKEGTTPAAKAHLTLGQTSVHTRSVLLLWLHPMRASHGCPRLQLSKMASLMYACRRHLAGLLKEHSLVEGGDLQVATWIKDEGFDTTIPSVMQVLQSEPLQDPAHVELASSPP